MLEQKETTADALERLTNRTEELLDRLEQKEVQLPLWTVATVNQALDLAHQALEWEDQRS